MMKRVLAFVLALTMAVTAIGCAAPAQPAAPVAPDASQSDSDEQTAGQTGEGNYKVAYIARTLSDAFASWLANEMQKSAKQYEDTFTLDVLDSQGDSEKQNTLIETCITKGYDCIIIQPNDGESQRPYAEKIIKAGIKCITTNAQIPGIEGASSVDANPYNQGAVLAEAAKKAVPENGKVVIISCLPGNLHTTARLKAFQEVFIQGRPDVTIVDERIFNEVDSAGTLAYMEDIVQSKGKIDCVLTVADVLALAALEAVKDSPEFSGMLAYGVDGISGSLLSVKAGKQTGTCLQNAVELADKNMKMAHDLLTGAVEQSDDAIGEVYIDSSNVDEWITKFVEYGLLSEEDIAPYYN